MTLPRYTPPPRAAVRAWPALVPHLELVAACSPSPALAWVTDLTFTIVQAAGPLLPICGASLLGTPVHQLGEHPETMSVIMSAHELARRGRPAHYVAQFRERVYRGLCQPVRAGDTTVGVLGIACLVEPTPQELAALFQALAQPASAGPPFTVVTVVDIPRPLGGILPARTELVLRTPDPVAAAGLPVYDTQWLIRNFKLGLLALTAPLPLEVTFPGSADTATTPTATGSVMPVSAAPPSAAPPSSGAPRSFGGRRFGAHRSSGAGSQVRSAPELARGPLRLLRSGESLGEPPPSS